MVGLWVACSVTPLGWDCGYFDVCTVATTPFRCLLLGAALGRDMSHPQAVETRDFGKEAAGSDVAAAEKQ